MRKKSLFTEFDTQGCTINLQIDEKRLILILINL